MAKKKGLDFKGLMLAHVEKVACGVIAICFVFLLYVAFSREPVKGGIEPADISAVAQRAGVVINQTKWEDFSDKPQMRNFAQESGWYDVPVAPYKLSVEWNPELFPRQALRDDPTYYPVRELEAHFDQGPLALLTAEIVRKFFNPPMQPVPPDVEKELAEALPQPPKFVPVAPDAPNKVEEGAVTRPVKIELPGANVEEREVAEGRRWIMVNALVPWQEQIDAFRDTFRNAAGLDQKNDQPSYFGYEVERADVTGGAAPVWVLHDKISAARLFNSTIRWANNKRTEIIAKPNIDPIFTTPLPPRALELWGSEDKHSKIPLEAVEREKAEQAAVPMQEPDELLGLAENVPDEPRVNASDSASSQVEYKMLRYFDFKVLPGHTYQYRFRAALRDPNYVREGIGGDRGLRRVELKFLEESVVRRINEKRATFEKNGVPANQIERVMAVIYTEWSDPSPAVKIPPDLYILALKAEQPPDGRYNVEPWASLLVTKYDNKLGLEIGADTRLQRGNIANFVADGIRIINVNHSTLETRQVPFTTNHLLVDLRGGEALDGSPLLAPSEVLLFDMEQGGRLVVADEVDDAPAVLGFRQRKQQIDKLIPKAETNPGAAPTGPRDTDIIR